MDFKDYYRTLGVERQASADEIKKAYRKLARRWHPDVSKEPDAAARMAEVNEAYAALSDPQRRAVYDDAAQAQRQGRAFRPGFGGSGRAGDGDGDDDEDGFGAADLRGGFGGGGATPDEPAFSAFFEELLRRAARAGSGGGAAGGRSDVPLRGEDHHVGIVLDLADAFQGARRQLSLRLPQHQPDGSVRLQERVLEVTIPRGIRPGQLIRLAGQGGAGSGGATAGDLLLEVRLRPHPRFRVDGPHLVAELPLAPWEAALGAVVAVPLPDDSRVNVRVPAGAQPGQTLTVRGRGFPGGSPPSDLELHIRVVLPSAMDPRAKKLYEDMAAQLPDFDARKVHAAEQERTSS